MAIFGKILGLIFLSIPFVSADGVCNLDNFSDMGFVTCRNLVDSDDYLYQMYKLKPDMNDVSSIYIWISESKLSEIDQWFVEPLPKEKVTDLYLNNCGIKLINSNALSGLSALTSLSLDTNSIKSYEFLLYLNKLRYLSMAENGIGNDDGSFLFGNISSTNIFSIDLSNNKISNIKSVPAGIKKSQINLAHNDFKSFDLTETGIVNVDLSYNDITEIYVTQSSASPIKLNLTASKIKSINPSKVSIDTLIASSLSSLDLNFLTNVTQLNSLTLSGNKISTLDNNVVIKSLSSKSTLDLSNTNLESISQGIFNDTTKLSELILSFNKISKIQAYIFNNSQIDVLDFSNSQVSDIDTDAFANLKVTTLNLTGNNLKSVGNVFSRAKISTLDMSSNPITSIKKTSFPTSVQYINLTNASITDIDDQSFYNLAGLISLSLTVKDSFSSKSVENHFLKTLDIAYSSIPKLSKDNFKGLYSLQELYFTGSVIKSFDPACLNGLFSLQYLDSQTLLKNVSVIPSGLFKDLKSLIYLDLSNLNVSNVSYNVLQGLVRLNQLDLSGNNISTIAQDTFQDLASLTLLNLSGNRLVNLSSQTFQNLSNLQKLYLNDNALSSLPVDLFQNTSLTHLYLSMNFLSSLEPGLFSHLKALNVLDLSGNRIVTVKSEVFKPLTSLTDLNLENNLLHSLSFLGNEFNYTSLLNTVTPKKIRLNGNPWECRTLGVMLNYIGQYNVEYEYPDRAHYDETNVVGITCSLEENVNDFTEALDLVLL